MPVSNMAMSAGFPSIANPGMTGGMTKVIRTSGGYTGPLTHDNISQNQKNRRMKSKGSKKTTKSRSRGKK